MKLSPISISLSPNVQRDDLYLSLKILLSPWKWKKGKFQIILEEYFKEYLKVKHTFFFNSGRSSLYVLLKALNPERVYIQGFTCNALVNPILWNKIKPVYVDCDEKDFNIDIKDLKEKIIFNGSGGVLIVQHTFGMPAEMEEILKIAKENNLIIVEDCAHSLGAEYLGRKIGTIGKASFFSFSRDKIISSVYGGFIATNDDILAEKINDIYKEIKNPSCFWIFQQLLHPILLNFLILPTYSFFGKYLLVFFQKTRILSKAVSKEEKKGEKPEYFPRKFPNALALLALNQIKKIDTFYNHRRKVAGVYYNKFKNSSYEIPKGMYPENLDFLGKKHAFLRYSIIHPDAHNIIKKAWKKNILIGDWYTSPIAPKDTDLTKMLYSKGDCINAERLSKKIINLPTHINISKQDIDKIVDFLMKF